ncbi:MAG: electron transfer flavoprotein subunit alpha/FixB family protein [Oscillospiraceae bacterium]
MEKIKNVWVVASGVSTINELTCGAARLGDKVTLIYAGERASAVNADKAYYLGGIGADASFVSYIPTVAAMAADSRPELILLDSSKNGRLAASFIAVACGTAVQTDASEIEVSGGAVLTKKMVYGGAATKTEKSGGTAVVCVGAGVFSAGEAKPAAEIEDVSVAADSRVKFIVKREKAGVNVNLAAAKRVVGVGRGLGDETDLALCRDFAALLGAELGCTRPICEERQWMPKETYIGVSGVMVQPELYVAIGISGQVQHVVGINKSGTIIAIDKNEASPIFKACDYGIVGDLRKVVPALAKLMSRE